MQAGARGCESNFPTMTGSAIGRVRQAGETRSAPIESVRALAALAVLGAHVYGDAHHYGATVYATFLHRALLGGGFGVFVFFTLTGYLLYLPFARRDVGGGSEIRLGRYASNRVVRIFPLYYVVTVVYLLVLPHSQGGRDWVRFLLFGQNFFHSTVARLDGPAWSLVVELHFYILLPLLAAGVARVARGSRTRAAATLALVGLAALGLRISTFLTRSHVDPRWQYNLPATFFFFVPGMLLAVVKVVADTRGPEAIPAALRSSTGWLVAGGLLLIPVFYRYAWDPFVGAAAFCVVGACVLPLRDSRGLQLLAWRPLAVLGTASYSLYLWHLPIVDHLVANQLAGRWWVLDEALIIPLIILIALVSYAVIEAPWLRLRRQWQTGRVAQTGTPSA